MSDGSPVTMDYRPDRVRIFVDGNGIVVSVPRAGWTRWLFMHEKSSLYHIFM